MNKKYAAILIFFIAASSAFLRGFDEKIFSPGIGLAGGFSAKETHNRKTFYIQQSGLGPSLYFDMVFNIKKNGFTFMFNNVAFPFFLRSYEEPLRPPHKGFYPNLSNFGVLWYMEALFGYTYGIGSDFELSVAVGLGFQMPVYPAINAKLSASYYFSEKYGIYFGLGNSLGLGHTDMFYAGHPILPASDKSDSLRGREKGYLLITNLTTFSIGPVFRLK